MQADKKVVARFVQADEKVVARLQELRPLQREKARGLKRDAPEVLEFDKLLVEEIERGVSAAELAVLLGYKTVGGVCNRYKRIKKNYSIGFTQTGEVKSTQSYRMGTKRKKMKVRDLVDKLQMNFLPDEEVDTRDVVELMKELEGKNVGD